ncbi:MAG: hypothetical protein L0215_23580 [Gemmataceae bacterium]|nr:hypothetical protein [Gemmataceae bacterium]
MTLIDFIKLGIIRTDAEAERFAADLVDRWHDDLIPGELNEIIGLTTREYQAWTTGGVSLLTIANWHQTSHPPLNVNKPWFRHSGRPGQERVGYLADRTKKSQRRKALGANKA